MRARVRKRFHGVEKQFDKWWWKTNGGYDQFEELAYLKLPAMKHYLFLNYQS